MGFLIWIFTRRYLNYKLIGVAKIRFISSEIASGTGNSSFSTFWPQSREESNTLLFCRFSNAPFRKGSRRSAIEPAHSTQSSEKVAFFLAKAINPRMSLAEARSLENDDSRSLLSFTASISALNSSLLLCWYLRSRLQRLIPALSIDLSPPPPYTIAISAQRIWLLLV